MATIKEIRGELIELRKFLVSQKAGFSTASKKHVNEDWYQAAIKGADKVRERINFLIKLLDAVTG